ncbi:hypothetical protein R69776_04593 [Paraburkholderia nemoris]|uniref:Uncharacterized protein n=1 Tax=Paraburkholderia nemoris TaxID=2793076 RepID=A0ABN7M7A7_9BURK|nr:hypothetical protein R69776_04593 [Paraburkholderia nemoris]
MDHIDESAFCRGECASRLYLASSVAAIELTWVFTVPTVIL